MTILLTLLGRLWPYILAAAVAAFLFYKAEHWCNSVCMDARAQTAVQRDRADTAEQKLAELDRARIQQQERWAQATAAEEQRGRRDAESRTQVFAPIRARVNLDPDLAAATLPPDLARLSVDAFAAADPAGSAGKSEDSAASDTTAAAWITDLAEWSAECRDRVSAWERFYNDLRS